MEEKPTLWMLLFAIVLFMALGFFMWYKVWTNKYDWYYYYYINQYPSMETINHIQDMSNDN